MNPKEILQLCKDKGIVALDLKFCDFPGSIQHTAKPIADISEDSFSEGFGFDGSSIRGWQVINESDMLILPDTSTAYIDPFFKYPTLSMFCTVLNPRTRENYSRDPRNILSKADSYMKSTGLADTAYFGPELEFFLFKDVRYASTTNGAFYQVDSDEAIWNSGDASGKNLGYKLRHKEGYFPALPHDTLADVRQEIVNVMEEAGMHVETHHHEVATAGQCEIDLRFAPMQKMADMTMLYKYIVRNVARRHGLAATFMPKPLYGDNGSGMHTHMSLWKEGKPLFFGNGPCGLSEMALYYIGGIIKHAHALIALTNPTTNSYKRLVPGYEAPVNLVYSQANRSAAIRIPTYSNSPKAKRIEFRTPDCSCNPYIAFAAMLMAGIDGIVNKIDPGLPLDKNIYDLPAEELATLPAVPHSLPEALKALEKDHEFLLKGGVFTQDVIETWIEYKYNNEVRAVNQRPHPHEFFLYFDC
jgi:glutamine synthetase